MFDFGFSEMLIVGIVALVVLGPERLPVVARTAGEWIGKAQRFVAQVKSDIDRETELSELKKIQEEAQAIANDVKTEVESTASDIEKNMNETAKAVEAAGESIESSVNEAAAETGAADAAGKLEKAAEPVVQKVRTTTPEDLAQIYGWGSNESEPPQPTYGGWTEPKTFKKRYHSGPSVDELAQEIERLRRELGMRETNMGGTVGRRRALAPRARSNRTRIYR
ncbi:twin-arginine translocase subunit TatB [Sutterella massiliensis]|uniref:Sec-independent protein translocase protein TatB n=1 Tax=Sutterella massiliensis TaxID=1816689 RepID=A0ABS2DTJ8_9BURK|nr:Sec-independent protein translocase protein TatB [Sutterella massiliensis]MBM6704617.1 twin-arginine translocase subunit TatB [Sutterella massiliensis]